MYKLQRSTRTWLKNPKRRGSIIAAENPEQVRFGRVRVGRVRFGRVRFGQVRSVMRTTEVST